MTHRKAGRICSGRKAAGDAPQAQPRRASDDRLQVPDGAGRPSGPPSTDQSREGHAAPASPWHVPPDMVAKSEQLVAANLDKLPRRMRARAMRNLGIKPEAVAEPVNPDPYAAEVATTGTAGTVEPS